MSELTYRDYIKYLEEKTRDFQTENLSSEEMLYFSLVKKELENAPDLPKHILDTPLISSNKHNDETLLAVAEVKKSTSFNRRFLLYINDIVEKIKQKLDIESNSQSFSFIGGAASAVFLLLALFVIFNSPYIGSANSLVGAAGQGDIEPGVIYPGIIIVIILVGLVILIFSNKKK